MVTNSESSVFHFVDFFSKDFRKIIFTSPRTGKVVVRYPSGIPPVVLDINMQETITRFINCFSEENRHLPKFLKTELLSALNQVDTNDRMDALLKRLSGIIDSAEINFEVYLNDLSIEEIRKEYDDYKHKYFEETSTVLGKLTSKIIGLPIAISTTVFAITKASESEISVILLVISISIATYYIGILLKINIKDLKDIKHSISNDYQVLLKSEFFLKYPKELIHFEQSKSRLESRVTLVDRISKNYFYILFFSNLIILVYGLSYLLDRPYLLFFIFCTGGIFIALLRKYFLDE